MIKCRMRRVRGTVDYLIDPNSGRSYYSQFLATQGSDVAMRASKALAKIEKGNVGRVTRLTFKNELYYAPLYEYEIDYKQGVQDILPRRAWIQDNNDYGGQEDPAQGRCLLWQEIRGNAPQGLLKSDS